MYKHVHKVGKNSLPFYEINLKMNTKVPSREEDSLV